MVLCDRETVIRPFDPDDHRHIAVEIVDGRGIDSLEIMEEKE